MSGLWVVYVLLVCGGLIVLLDFVAIMYMMLRGCDYLFDWLLLLDCCLLVLGLYFLTY